MNLEIGARHAVAGPRSGLAQLRRPRNVSASTPRLRRGAVQPAALMGNGPAYNKYRSRQDIERDYYKEWERTTLIAREELDRPMTIFTFLAFLPAWFKFYGLPGPVRFVLYLLSRRVAAVAHVLHKRAVVQGARLDRELVRRAGLPQGTLSRRLVLLRFHHRVPALENVKFRWALLRGQAYEPKVLPAPEGL